LDPGITLGDPGGPLFLRLSLERLAFDMIARHAQSATHPRHLGFFCLGDRVRVGTAIPTSGKEMGLSGEFCSKGVDGVFDSRFVKPA
jgi:hypothetical protein